VEAGQIKGGDECGRSQRQVHEEQVHVQDRRPEEKQGTVAAKNYPKPTNIFYYFYWYICVQFVPAVGLSQTVPWAVTR
jgi:hypothetical protein